MDPSKNISVKSKQYSKNELEFDRIIQHIRQESRVLILMRGLPGSGKSYLARSIVDRSVGIPNYSSFILSTDDYFYNQNGTNYIYDVTKLQWAHEWNQQRAYMKMSAGSSPVIIDNTNTQMWEMKSYVMMAANFGYAVEIVETFTPWAFDPTQLSLRNKHNVPKAKIRDMLLRYEKNITPTNIFTAYNLSYSNLVPPVKRTYPPLKSTLNKNADDTASLVREIDLMGFDEESNANDGVSVAEETKNMHSNLVDSLLLDSQVNTETTVLKPNVNSNRNDIKTPPKKKKTCSDSCELPFVNSQSSNDKVKKPIDIYPTLNLSSWGLSEEAVSSWESWDMVTPLTKTNTSAKPIEESAVAEIATTLNTTNSSTNTSSYDFSLLSTNHETLKPENVNIIRAFSRDINVDHVLQSPTTPSKRMLFHKGSMTDDYNLQAKTPQEGVEDHIEQLIFLFPAIPLDYLRDVYEKCSKDINWAVDLLLDDNREIATDLEKNINNEPTAKNSTHAPQLNPTNESSSTVSHDAIPLASTEEINRLKEHIEGSIEINRNFYSDHVMKIKTLKRNGDSICKNLNQPSSSKEPNFEIYNTSSGEVIACNSDIDVNHFDSNIEFPQSEESEEQQTVEINLGDTCIKQLESLFGFPDTFPQGFLPIVQIPLELAEQLHAFYIQSVLGQMEAQNNVLDMITKEDEELAKQLQNEDNHDIDDKKVIDLQDIMKEQVADRLYQKKLEEWKKLTPDTLAAKLTMQKLIDSFPSINKTLLMEILHAHNNSYTQTVEVLLASTDPNNVHDPDGNIRDPPISDSVINDMNKARAEKVIAENAPDISKTANEYREEANSYHRKHNDYMQKAQAAFQNRQYPVAQFYSDLAKSYTQLYEHTNSLAATAFLHEHSTRLQNFHTLDLHYLYVKEAIPALDVFIDSNIRLIAESNKNKENLFVITGRGKRSVGKSRLKPAVIARLQKRGLQWMELNPGLLKFKITPYSAVSNNV